MFLYNTNEGCRDDSPRWQFGNLLENAIKSVEIVASLQQKTYICNHENH